MGRLAFVFLMALTLAAFPGAGQTRAQGLAGRPVPSQRPTVSPYLNLLRGGNQALNYYNLVRPQTEFQQSIQQLRQDVATNRQTIGDLDAALTLPSTGHATRFMDYSKFFLTQGGQTAAGRSPGTISAARAVPRAGPPNVGAVPRGPTR